MTDATLIVTPGCFVGIFGANLENTMEIAAEIIADLDQNELRHISVDGEWFAVTSTGTYFPTPHFSADIS